VAKGYPDYTLAIPPPIQSNMAQFVEDFIGGSNNNGSIGAYGWSVDDIGNGMSVSSTGSFWPNLGVRMLGTGGFIGDGGQLGLNPPGCFGELGKHNGWDSYFVFLPGFPSDMRLRIGFGLNPALAAVPDDGFWLRYDTSVGYVDTGFKFCSRRHGGAESALDSGVGVGLGWVTLRMRSVETGTILVSLNKGKEKSIGPAGCDLTATLTDLSLGPVLILVTDAYTIKFLWVDFFAFQGVYLNR